MKVVLKFGDSDNFDTTISFYEIITVQTKSKFLLQIANSLNDSPFIVIARSRVLAKTVCSFRKVHISRPPSKKM